MNPKLVLWLGSVFAVFAVLFGTYQYGRHVEALVQGKARDKAIIEQQEKNRLDLITYANGIIKAGADHDKNTRTIRNLSRELDGMRVNFPTCPVSDTTEAGTDSGGGSGILSNSVDALFERLQRRAGILIERCDTLNIDAIRRNAIGQ